MSFLYDVRSGKVVKSKLYSNNLLLKDVLNFNPMTLFAGGNQGVWYDPSDKSTLFQDVAGTVPVTKDGDPVGLILDKSQGVVLGSELVANGNFDTNINGWEVDRPSQTTATWVDGRVLVSPISGSSPSSQSLKQNIELKVGVTYKISIEHEGIRPFRVRLGSTYVVFDNKGTGKQAYTGYVTLSSAASTLYVDMASGTSWLPADMYLDNISIKEVKGNHATQSVSAARPIYKTDGILHWLESDGVDDELTSTTQGFITERILISVGFEITQYGGVLAPSHLLGLHQSGVTYSRLGFRASSANSTYVQGVSRIRSGNFLRGSEVTALLGTRYVGTMKQTQGQITTTLNNATDTAAVDPLLKNPELANFKLFFSNQLAPCKFFGGIVLLEPPSDVDISSINTYLAAKSGVTL